MSPSCSVAMALVPSARLRTRVYHNMLFMWCKLHNWAFNPRRHAAILTRRHHRQAALRCGPHAGPNAVATAFGCAHRDRQNGPGGSLDRRVRLLSRTVRCRLDVPEASGSALPAKPRSNCGGHLVLDGGGPLVLTSNDTDIAPLRGGNE